MSGPGVQTTDERGEGDARWHARPLLAGLLRASALLLPLGASVAFVWEASRLVPPPSDSLGSYVGWWLGLSIGATLILTAVGRVTRRLLPLAALLRLSLVFPDGAPSRFRTALQSGTVKTLEKRLEEAKANSAFPTPADAARHLLSLVATLESHDRLTRGHSERVRAYAQVIGRQLRLEPHQVDRLNWAALLHDVGKLEIPTEILTRKGRPTEDEWTMIRRHPAFGEQLVAPLREWLGEWVDAVGYHHERWDGTGYPRGVAGTDIPLAGRLVAVADTFDVITSTRSYKQASSRRSAREEIARCAGTQFDPEIVRAFLAISFGRVRYASGPLSWLADAAVLAKIPLVGAAGTVAAAAVVIAPTVSPSLGSGRESAAPQQPPAIERVVAPPSLSSSPVATAGRRVAPPAKTVPTGARAATIERRERTGAAEPDGVTGSATPVPQPAQDSTRSDQGRPAANAPVPTTSPEPPPSPTPDPVPTPVVPDAPTLTVPVLPALPVELPPLTLPPTPALPESLTDPLPVIPSLPATPPIAVPELPLKVPALPATPALPRLGG